MRTYSPKPGEITREWHVIDATDVVLGRLAVQAANLLRGKHKPTFAPHVDSGDFVIIINADKVALTGDKATQKLAYRHSGYPGGLRVDAVRRAARQGPRARPSRRPSGACSRRTRSAARCSRSSRCTPAPSTRTQAQQAAAVRDHPGRPVTSARSQHPDAPKGDSWPSTRPSTDDAEADELRGRRAERSPTPPRRAGLAAPPGRAATIVARGAPPAAARRPSPASGSSPAPASGRSTAAPSRPTSRTRCTSRSSTSRSRSLDLDGRYDVIARIHGGGITGQAGALRLGMARALNEIDVEANRPPLKKAGFLTRDARVNERKKAGLKKARKAPQYSKR